MQTTLKKPADPLSVAVDLLVVCVGDDDGAPEALDAALGGAIGRAMEDGEVAAKRGTVAVFPGGGPGGPAARRVALAGIGAGGTEEWRAAGAAVARRANAVGAREVALAAPAGAGAAALAAFVDGLGTANHRDDRFRAPADDAKPLVAGLQVLADGVKAADLSRADRLVAAVNGAKDLVNTPSNHLTPTALADHAQSLAAGVTGLECEVLGPKELKRLGAGALLGVAQGSDEPPRMIVLRYRPKRTARKGELLGLVGKAVTFDTGGISIKPSSGMEEMKMDMGGGAAVIEGTALVAALGLPVPVLAVVPSTENMPSGHAIKPGDVLRAMNGKTIEVINTDAEGRLILADGLVYAVKQGATRLVDMATLTGAIVVALGEVYAGLFGSDADWTEEVRRAAEDSGDLSWPMPMHERYAPLIKSKIADLSNASNKRQAGSVYAAQFLREFTDGRPWCHLDVAGTAMVDGRGTGFGVRLIRALAERLSVKAT